MKQLTAKEIDYMQDLINSLQYECSKAKNGSGYVSPSYIKEKTEKINNA